MQFLSEPNLPNKKVGAVLIDYRSSRQIVNSLKNLNIKVYFTCEVKALYDSVRGHPDMSIHHIGNNCFVCEPTTYEYYKNLFKNENINLIKGFSVLTSTYPYDIAYNIARVSNYAFHKTAYTDKYIKDNSLHIHFVDVSQGYSKCAVCPISKNAIITDDESIFINARKIGIDTLKIEKGSIFLKDFDYGFFGGSTGLLSNDLLAVTGNVENIVDHAKIIDFCAKYGVKVYSLTEEKPIDIGSIIPIAY